MVIELTKDHGYAIGVACALWFQQSIVFTIKVGLKRREVGIKPPTLYPNDSEIKSLKLTPEQVDSYMCTQRVHQNNGKDIL